MKKHLALALLAGLTLAARPSRAQNDAPATPPPAPEAATTVAQAAPAPAPTPAAPAPAPTPAAPPAAPAPAETPTPATSVAAVSPEHSTAAANDLLPLIMFEDAPLNDAIKTLARQAGINFQFDPRVATPPVGPDGRPPVQPTVSIRFENVTAQQALEAVLANHGLQLVADPKTRTARVTIKDPAAPDPLTTKVIQLKYASPTNLLAIIKPTLGPRSSVTPDVRTSTLIVMATEKEMFAVDALVESLDAPTRQVLIEARILETAKAPSTIKGIDWSGTLEAQKVSFGNNQGDPTGAPANNNLLVGSSPTSKLLVDTARGFNPATAFLDADGVSAVLSFLNKDSDTEVVATPRAVTLDNEKAMLSITRAFPIITVTPGSANSPAGAQITYTNLGTILEVTPRISANNMIALRVVPEVSNIDSRDSQTINGTLNTANIYAIRKIEANVVIPSGNTLVMGGLISDTQTRQYTKVPVLGDLPGVGLAFRKDSKTRNKSNLIIFVTPTIVTDNDFHPTTTDFLKNRVSEVPDNPESPWDSGKPAVWKRSSAAR
jgi:type II secretory pathway component GspD/PulD (secretin)